MCSHCPHLGVGDESSESCPLLLLMGKKSLKSFKEKRFMPVAFLTSFDRPCPGGYGRGERATLTNASQSALKTVGVMTECCRAPLYVIDFKAGQNFEGQVEPLELAAGRAHPILSLTLADGRQVSLAHPLRDRKSIPCGLSHTSVLLCAANSAAQLYLLWAPATRVADRDIGAVTLNLCGPESNSNDAGRSWPQARTTIIASMKLVIIRTPDMDVTDAQHCTSDVRKGRRESSALAKCHRAENQADSIEL